MITVVGEALIHLARTSDATMLRASPGGNALNVAVAAARLGYPTALIARLSRDLYPGAQPA
jgi:sugar/nucleoside kinase (ribokinase family)